LSPPLETSMTRTERRTEVCNGLSNLSVAASSTGVRGNERRSSGRLDAVLDESETECRGSVGSARSSFERISLQLPADYRPVPSPQLQTEHKIALRYPGRKLREVFLRRRRLRYSSGVSPSSLPCRSACRRSSLRLARSAARLTSSEPTSSSIACSAPSPLRFPRRTTRT
jgi:hypothetical protein